MAKRNALSESELRTIIQAEINGAESNEGSALAGQRVENIQYYLAEPFGNEIDGRSKVVSADLRDVIEWIKPSLMRIFTSGDKVVEFAPQGPEDVEAAKQATEYVNHIWNVDNPGFLNFYTWFTDALLSKNGQVKIWWDDTPVTKRESYYGLDDAAFAMLVNDDTIEVVEHTESQQLIEHQVIDQQSGQPVTQQVPVAMHDVVISREKPGGKVCVIGVTPENFIISNNARSIEDAVLAGDWDLVSASDLREEGYTQAQVDNLGTPSETGFGDTPEALARNTVEQPFGSSSEDDATREIKRYEVFVKVDYDGDGVAEMRKVVLAGPGYKILKNEPWEGPRPYANLTAIPMPHRFYGLAIADLVKDIQLIKSTIQRQFLDGLYLAGNPRSEVVEANIIDPSELINSKPGGNVRVTAAGSINPITVAFQGAAALEGLNYIDTVLERRTGVSERVQGLNPNQINNESATAARLAMSAAQGKIELIARIFAETGVKDAFRLIYQLVKKYQQEPRIIRLLDNFVSMDPRSWNDEMDTSISVGMGTGDKEQQLQHAMMIGQMQEKAQALGMVTPDNFMATASLILGAMGIKGGATRFFSKPDPNAPPKPDPAMAKVQADAQAQQQKQQSDAQLQQQKMQMSAQESAAQMQADQAAAQAKAQSDYQAKMQQAGLDIQQQRYEFEHELALKRQQLEAELALKRAELMAELQLKREAMEHDAAVKNMQIASSVHVGGDQAG